MKKIVSILLKTVLVLFAILVISLGIFVFIQYNKLNKIKLEQLNSENLSINENLSEEVDDLTKEEFNEVFNAIIFGSDSRDINNEYAGRSDVMMLVSINPKFKSIKLISIPRDTYVSIPGYWKTKINAAYAYGKEELAIKTINSNFGLDIDKYVTVDFVAVMHIINILGGVEANITEAEKAYINAHSREGYSITKNPYVSVEKSGSVTLSGEQALSYSRDRTTGEGNDYARTQRQRYIVESVIKKLSNMGINEVLSLSEDVFKEIKTNIKIEEYLGYFTNLAKDANTYKSNIISYQIPNTTYAVGGMVGDIWALVPDIDVTKSEFIEYLYNK